MKKMDLKQNQWEYDIASWNRWIKLYHRLSTSPAKDGVRNRLIEIQAKWPQYIKESEIPIN